MRTAFCLLALTFLTTWLGSVAIAQPLAAKRIVFLGDSITQNGRYVECLEAAWIASDPNAMQTCIPLGLASETVSGLTEPGHAGGAFPRPELRERLQRVLDKTKPDLVFACYGMNDGIYHPYSAERAEAFQSGMRELHAAVVATGARIIHITPPVFDPMPIRDRVLPSGLDRYERPFVDYNSVLDRYSEWLLQMRDRSGWTVIDLHGPMNAALSERRMTEPAFAFAPDGVHPTEEGQVWIARLIASEFGMEINADGTPNHPNAAAILEAIHRKHALLRPAWLSHVGHTRPGIEAGLPLEQAQTEAASYDDQARAAAKNSP